ncbi:MAG: type I-E CRISPR-associated protein Cse2/CasB [Chloroflexi bacterium]|nr:type I-E CRISPR-associated protein Cse2/CasB [Chloroflexota bacterium]
MNEEHDHDFINYLQILEKSNNRAALAALRRGLGKPPGSEPLMYPYIVPELEAMPVEDEAPYFLVASLFALHPQSARNENLGIHLRKLWRQSGADEPPPNIERRFVMLLAAHPNDMYKLIQPIVNLLKAGTVPLDWYQLLYDLKRWQNPDTRSDVRRAWAYQFWKREAQNKIKSQLERSQ